jgi:hypothetical protein
MSLTCYITTPLAPIHKSLITQATQTIDLTAGRRGIPSSTPQPVSYVGRFLTHTVFDKEWATVTIDEFHEFRTRSSGYWAVLSLAEKAKVIVGATATPLFNGFQVRFTLIYIFFCSALRTQV